MKYLIKQHWQQALLVIGIWNAVGFLCGSLVTMNNRTETEWKEQKDGTHKTVDVSTTGCIYKSWSSFTNPGYVISCELMRRRFEYEGIDKVLNK